MNDITIIIPAYNQARYLAETIESALSQTYPCPIIVVNDGSTDNTSEIANRYTSEARVKLIEQENRGLSGARNTAIRELTTPFIVSLDSDDTLDPTYIEKCRALADEDTVVTTGGRAFGAETWVRVFQESEMTPPHFIRGNRCHASSMFSKKMWETVHGFDERMREGYEDWDFWIRVSVAGFKFKAITELLLNYRRHEKSMTAKIKAEHNTGPVDYIQAKHHHLYAKY